MRIYFLIVMFALFSLMLQSEAATKTLVYCSEASPAVFNPQLATDGPTFNASSRTIYNRLVEFETGGTKIIPGLAESWNVSKDGKTFTFKLRKDVKFHATDDFKPTRNLNADDILFSFNRMLDKKHPYHNISGGTYEYFNSMDMGSIIKSIKKVDDYTVIFQLSRPEAPFLANMAMDFASILSKEYGDNLLNAKTPEKIDNTPVGTGPFKLKRYVKDNLIRYEAHPDYFLGRAKVDKLVFNITTDPSVRYQKLKTGECHIATDPSPSDLKAIRKNSGLNLLEQPGLNIGYLAMNVEKKPLNNVLVRKALNYALNRDAYIKAIYLGHAKKAKNPIPPSMWGYNKSVKGYEYNPKKAKELLAKAGYPKGFSLDLWTLPVSRPYNPNGKKMGEMIQADLAKIGVKVKLITYKWATYLDKSSKGEHELLQLGWTGDNGDPDNFLNVLLGCEAAKGGSNRARWCDKKFNHLIQKAKVTTTLKTRTDLYQEAQEIFNKQAPWVPIAHSVVFKAVSKKVKGYQISPFGTESFYEVAVE